MAIPNPRTWEDGEESANLPTAADLNADWKDAQDFALGLTRPIVVLNGNGGGSALPVAWTPVPFDRTADLVRGGMVHSTSSNPSRITVPETGRYRGVWLMGFKNAPATGDGRIQFAIRKNGDTNDLNLLDRYAPTMSASTQPGMSWEFFAELTAGDYIELIVHNGTGSATLILDDSNKKPRVMFWYDSAN